MSSFPPQKYSTKSIHMKNKESKITNHTDDKEKAPETHSQT